MNSCPLMVSVLDVMKKASLSYPPGQNLGRTVVRVPALNTH